MLTTDQQELKCTLCRQSFSPPYTLPHLLPCTHYVCTHCLNKAQKSQQYSIICPEDYQNNPLTSIRSNCSARRALQKLVKQHSSFNQNNQLLCIQSLSQHFETALKEKNKEKLQFKELVERVIQNEIKRLQNIYNSVSQEMEGPIKMVQQWKEMVKECLSLIKTMDRTSRKEHITAELNYFIDQGRQIKTSLAQYQRVNFSQIANIIAVNPSICLRNEFSLQKYIQIQNKQDSTSKTGKEDALKKEQQSKFTGKTSNKQKSISSNNSKRQKEVSISKSKFIEQSSINKQNSHLQKIDYVYHKHINLQDCNSQKSSRNGNKIDHLSKCSLPIENIYLENFNLAQDQKLLIYSPDGDLLDSRQQHHSEENLLIDKEEKSQLTHSKYNFLQEFEITESASSDSLLVERREPFDWKREQNSYIRKMQVLKVDEAVAESSYQHKCLQLINYPISDMDISLYLNTWNKKEVEVIKLVNTGFTDHQLNELLNYTLKSKVVTLVLSGNNLGQVSLDALLNYIKAGGVLKNVYLSKNFINPLRGKTRAKLTRLRQEGVNLYI